MASNQFLLVALCLIIVGASIRVGINQYKANEVEQNRIALMGNIQSIAIDSYTYCIKSSNLGGGKTSFVGYKLPKKNKTNDAGSYKVSTSKKKITITATSKLGYGTIAIAYDNNCRYVKKSLKYTGNFK